VGKLKPGRKGGEGEGIAVRHDDLDGTKLQQEYKHNGRALLD
jgi:hypothetical protein